MRVMVAIELGHDAAVGLVMRVVTSIRWADDGPIERWLDVGSDFGRHERWFQTERVPYLPTTDLRDGGEEFGMFVGVVGLRLRRWA